MRTEIGVESFLVWNSHDGLTPGENGRKMVIADSWLVRDGRVRAHEMHWDRFSNAVGRQGVGRAEIAEFRAAVTARLPRTGAWFPRVELLAGREPRLALRLRPAPRLRDTARVWVADRVDPRARPSVKGPDFAVQGRLRKRARLHGADEAILLDEDGHAVEGAFSSLLWWDGGHLCTAPDDGRILPGITRRLLLDRAARLGVTVRHTRVSPARLATCEVWITSALHGIRVVTGWEPGGAAAPHDLSAGGLWQAHLDSLLEPLPAG
ncbi:MULTISPECIES: aminotransferase class IV [Streptomyces]|uniref:Aminotransferase class IV n=2 Tax=Streptomyces caniscabiei TaxID=2746961 RepID=A0ABU4N3J5_9ACTN|nr:MULTISPECIES: aminotransferase class IV [Streptomyces]MBE4737285.1 aminotransferase class IV [Streptomyces caniscabiei]MBE4756045.1 aminotransferase class IV [Streptomyces caniscabiei]MBE4769937.1 aminotransferase class IV [Streptomyces caniscabiei]MBE4787116.1 aminotransferase class IV [Streptomyces caniscabiei]MBE4795479.1 aminotransferase class IV [Streptomyces caniscabiei]